MRSLLARFMFLVLLVVTVAAAPAVAQTYAVGDTLTVVQRPLPNIPSIVRPGDPLVISCEADPGTTGWSATLVRGALDVSLTLNATTYDPTTGWWTLAATTPEVPVFDLYDLRVGAVGVATDRVRRAVKVIPEFRATFDVIHITDPHLPTYLYYYQSGADTDSTTSENLRAITDDVNIINPEFVLLTGDLVNEGELEDFLGKRYYSRSMMHLNEFEVPTYLTAGNHDLGGWDDTPPSDGTARRDWWRFYGWKRLNDPPSGAPARTQDYSFDYRDLHFVGLEAYDNYDSWRYEIYGAASFTSMQLDWLEDDIAAASTSSRVILFHHYDFQYQLNYYSLGIDVSLSGHQHYDQDDNTYPMDVRTDNAGGSNRPFRLVKFDGSSIDPRPTLSAENEGRLSVDYAPANDGTNVAVEALVDNGHGESFAHGLLRILMPGGAAGYTAEGGVLTQVDDTGDHAVCYVEFPIPAYGTATVTVEADTTTTVGVPEAASALMLNAWPNPFNPRTQVAFELPEAGPCRLTIFDARGRTVVELFEGLREAGRHSEVWDGCDATGRAMPSGTYIVGLRAGGYAASRKIILAR